MLVLNNKFVIGKPKGYSVAPIKFSYWTYTCASIYDFFVSFSSVTCFKSSQKLHYLLTVVHKCYSTSLAVNLYTHQYSSAGLSLVSWKKYYINKYCSWWAAYKNACLKALWLTNWFEVCYWWTVGQQAVWLDWNLVPSSRFGQLFVTKVCCCWLFHWCSKKRLLIVYIFGLIIWW